MDEGQERESNSAETMIRLKRIHAAWILSTALLTAIPAYADEIVTDTSAADAAAAAEDSTDDTTASSEAAGIADGDLSGLFVEAGEDTVSHKGETLDEARSEDEALTGAGDGGSTVNIGHLYLINGVYVRNSDFPSEHNECWAYANNVYAKLWGHNFWSEFQDSENLLRNLPDEELTLTPEHLKAYVSAAPAGAALRVCNSDYLHGNDIGGHSQIIISHDENGFTVFEGGLSAWPHRREAYYTWTGYCYSGWPGRYQYIKYVKWPGAPAYTEGAAGVSAQDLGESRMEQLQPAIRKTFLDLVTITGKLIRGEATKQEISRITKALRKAAAMRETETETESETEPETVSETGAEAGS